KMKVVKFRQNGLARFGVLSGAVVFPVPETTLPADVSIISSEGIQKLRAKGDGILEAPLALASLKLEAPVHKPEKIICIGLNYQRQVNELKLPIPTTPVVFAKFSNTLWGHDVPLLVPAADDKLDYEAELAVIIGRFGKNIAARDAYDHVLGYCCANVLSAR